MKSPKHYSRRHAFQFLYQRDLKSRDVASASRSPTDILRELTTYFDHFEVPETLREFTARLVSGVLLELPAIDKTLSATAKNWSLARMPTVDRNILRLATWEILHLPETPRAVVINEAVDLAKHFGEKDSPGFVNGVLDKLGDKLGDPSGNPSAPKS
jgi:N utilization substance protein B